MNKGFIATTLVILVSSLLLVFTLSQSTTVTHFFDLTKTKEYRYMSYYSAYTCIDRVVLNISHDFFYEINEPINISDIYCIVKSVTRDNDLIYVEVLGNYKNIKVKKVANLRLYDNKVEILSIE